MRNPGGSAGNLGPRTKRLFRLGFSVYVSAQLPKMR